MKNTLTDLNNHLFEQLERLNDEDLQGEHLASEIERSAAIVRVSEQIVANASLVLKAQIASAERMHTGALPAMLACSAGAE